MPINMTADEAAAFSKLEALAEAQTRGAVSSTAEMLSPGDRQLLIAHADKIGEKPASPIDRAGLQRTESLWIAGTLGAMDPATREAPFRSNELNKVYEAQQQYESQLAQRMNGMDKQAALDMSR